MKQQKSLNHRLNGLKDFTEIKSVASEQSDKIRDSDNKKHWQIKKLGEVCEMYQPKTISTKEMVENGVYSVFGANGIIGKYDKYNHEEPQLLVTCRGATCGAVNISESFSWINGNAMVIRPKDNSIDLKFLEYLFRGGIDLSKAITGAAQPQITRQALVPIEIQFPTSLQEQHHIVSLLNQAFTAIAKAKANAQQNLKNAKELFESVLNGKLKVENGKWETKKWGELCDFVRGPFGGSLKKNVFKESGYVVYEQKHAIHDHFNQLRYFIDEEKFNEMKRFELFAGDIIMSCSGVTLGRVALVPKGIPKGIINQALLKLTPKKNVSVDFLIHWLRSKHFQDIIFKYSGGAAIPNVPSAKILKDIEIPLPPLKAQQQIVSQLDALRAETQKLEAVYQKKIDDLEELKKSILQKAFSGQLSESGLAGLKDEQDLQVLKKSGKSLNQLNPDLDKHLANSQILKS